MLVLNRAEGQSFWINDDIKIEIVRIKGNRAVIGITASGKDVIKRTELLERLEKEEKERAQTEKIEEGKTEK